MASGERQCFGVFAFATRTISETEDSERLSCRSLAILEILDFSGTRVGRGGELALRMLVFGVVGILSGLRLEAQEFLCFQGRP